jgi:hypothetical protein
VPVLGPVTSRSDVCLTAGHWQIAIEESLKIADSRSWGRDACVVREQGARVASQHCDSPHELGGPSEWLVMPPDGILLDRPLEGLWATLPESFHQM